MEIQSAEGDIETQKEQIREFTDESVNVIIVAAVDSSALETEIRNARNQGILVVSYERLVQGEQTDLFVAADSRMAGEQIADEIKISFRKGEVFCLYAGRRTTGAVRIQQISGRGIGGKLLGDCLQRMRRFLERGR